MSKVRVVHYATLRECMEAYYRGPVPAHGTWIGYDRNRKPYRRTMRWIMRAHRRRRCWAWVENQHIIHIWTTRETSMRELVRVLAHEIGHTEKPYMRRDREEAKAAQYEFVALTAYDIASQLRRRNRVGMT